MSFSDSSRHLAESIQGGKARMENYEPVIFLVLFVFGCIAISFVKYLEFQAHKVKMEHLAIDRERLAYMAGVGCERLFWLKHLMRNGIPVPQHLASLEIDKIDNELRKCNLKIFNPSDN